MMEKVSDLFDMFSVTLAKNIALSEPISVF